MNVKDVVEEYLGINGYDGLSHDANVGCGCGLDDLMPCQGQEEDIQKCELAYKRADCVECPDSSAEGDCSNSEFNEGCFSPRWKKQDPAISRGSDMTGQCAGEAPAVYSTSLSTGGGAGTVVPTK